MKTSLPLGLALAALVLGAGCASTPGARIAKNRAEFAAYPAEVQAAISKGEMQLGFTPEQAKLALGAPDRVIKRTSEAGVSDVWVYEYRRSRIGFGVGFGVGGGPVGAGVGTGSGGDWGERMRVVFEAGRVAAVEQVAK